ncbi:serine hydrolase domain-containing protein [Methylocystis sp. B8]|uniref:serine hydrolase domain-containing protein n=1 Tax=Methylocystis sp. B8 TaxID=544938 RepID=UPI0010FD114C|nr:serine hydrolase domain-containing protein [Methylocystis sp. B8]TLG78495.1 beta-lactamase family protein [Methylocystis sp. B8]
MLILRAGDALARDLSPAKIESALEISPPGASPRRLNLKEAMRALHVPALSVALIDGNRIAWTKTWGDATSQTMFQAASLSKLVTAVGALRLVERGALALDRDVNDDLTIWNAQQSALTKNHPVTLRWLLSMRAGVNVPGYPGYPPGAPTPDLAQILSGAPPATSPAVRVVDVPGRAYAYSGGGYEIVQALVEAKSGKSFEAAMRELVFGPAKMTESSFAQPPSPSIVSRAARGHFADGAELPGGWRVVPALAAGGLWSTPNDLAKLLVELSRAHRGEGNPLLSRKTALEMMTPQNGGPYGLGGAVAGSGKRFVLMKRGQNVGYQSYMLVFPETGQGIVVMTNSDNGTTLATAVIYRAAAAYRWPALDKLED